MTDADGSVAYVGSRAGDGCESATLILCERGFDLNFLAAYDKEKLILEGMKSNAQFE